MSIALIQVTGFMLEFLIFIVSFLSGYIFGKRRGKTLALRYFSLEQLKMRHNDLQRILEHLSTHDTVSDLQVERMFKINRQTADAYLKDLEHQGMIICTEKSGDVETYVLK
jgi:predicted HTH transcriptional regulator